LLDAYEDYTRAMEIPPAFKRLSLLHAVSACVGRQVYWKTHFGITYPNIYSMYVGGPGTGKSKAVSQINEFIGVLASENRIYVGATNMTKAALLDQLKDSVRSFKSLDKSRGEGAANNTYSHVNIFSSELGTLTDNYSPQFLSTLSTLYDCDPYFLEDKRKLRDKKKDEGPDIIFNPTVSLLSGTQPKYMTEYMPITAWEQGFATRVWFEYVPGSVQRTRSPFDFVEYDKEKFKEILRELERLLTVEGEIIFDDEAKKYFEHFYLVEDRRTAPNHSLLEGFNERRALKAQKIAVLIALCEREELIVRQSDVEKAIAMMYEAEHGLLDLLEVIGTSTDSEVIRAAYEFVARKFNDKGIGTTKAQLKLFVNNRGDIHKVKKYIEELVEIRAIEIRYGTINGIQDKTKELYYPVKGFTWKNTR